MSLMMGLLASKEAFDGTGLDPLPKIDGIAGLSASGVSLFGCSSALAWQARGGAEVSPCQAGKRDCSCVHQEVHWALPLDISWGVCWVCWVYHGQTQQKILQTLL